METKTSKRILRDSEYAEEQRKAADQENPKKRGIKRRDKAIHVWTHQSF